jgi:hypothetical protein
LAAAGLKLRERVQAVADSIDRVAQKGGLPPELRRLRSLLQRGLAATAHLWPEIHLAYRWVHQAAHLLANHDNVGLFDLRRTYRVRLAEVAAYRERGGFLEEAVGIFLKVTRSYWPGLFACYQTPDLPRTTNDLEHFFGSARYHERRATGRKLASPATVVRGAVRVVAAVATRLSPFAADDLRPPDLAAWRTLRPTLDYRHETRRAQLRFRRNSSAYLATLEGILLKSTLPS